MDKNIPYAAPAGAIEVSLSLRRDNGAFNVTR